MSTLNYKTAPQNAGVYIFRRGSIPLYIGKAANLKKRLALYFRKNAGKKVRLMLKESTKLDWVETASEIDALLKEAKLIKRHGPKYNVLMRDDKNYFYVEITKEKSPRIFITHQLKNLQNGNFIGPFTSGVALKSTLRLLRKIFPYCTCQKPHKRPCLNTEIGRCLGCCCVKNFATNKRSLASCKIRYKENIESLVAILNGRKRNLLKVLRKQMREAAEQRDFEKAARLRDQALGLQNIFEHRRSLEVEFSRKSSVSPRLWRKIEAVIRQLLDTSQNISRVEGYDISNISGYEATGSMVVFENGFPKKSKYRKFKIRGVRGPNDVAMLKEVIRRRLAHREWPYPDLMLVDGGKPQLNVALSQLSALGSQQSGKTKKRKAVSRLRVAALAKHEEELYVSGHGLPIRLTSLPAPTAHFLQRVRDESHRFAKKYHHKLREIIYREEQSIKNRETRPEEKEKPLSNERQEHFSYSRN